MNTDIAPMRYDMKLVSRFDLIMAILGLFVFTITALLLLSSETPSITSVVLLIGGLSCGLWIVLRKKITMGFEIESILKPKSDLIIKKILIASFFILLTTVLIIYSSSLSYVRPMFFFFVFSLMAAIVSVEILLFRMPRYQVLLQSIILGVLISYSQIALFPDLVGIDPFWHRYNVNEIISTGHIPLGTPYTKVPLFHLLLAASQEITGLNYKTSSFICITSIQVIICVISIYLIAKRIGLEEKNAQIAGLFVCLGNLAILSFFWAIPNFFAAVFILLILYLVYKKDFNFSMTEYVLVFLLMFALVITHPIASFFLSIFLVAYFIISIIVIRIIEQPPMTDIQKNKKSTTTVIPILFLTLMLSWWMYSSGLINNIAGAIDWGIGFSFQSLIPEIRNGVTFPFQEALLNNIGWFIFIGCSIFGLLYMISRNGNRKTIIMAVIVAISLAFGFIYVHTLNNGRSWFLAQIFASIPLGILTLSIYKLIPQRLLSALIVGGLVFLISFTSIIAPTANIDNHLLSPNSGIRYSITESEMTITQYLKLSNLDDMSTDAYYRGILTNYGLNNISNMDDEILNSTFDKNGYIIREYIMKHVFLVKGDIIFRPQDEINKVLIRDGYDTVYSSLSVRIYLNGNSEWHR